MFKFLILALALAASSTTAAADARAQLDAFAEDLQALSGSFEQVTIDETGRMVEKASGRLYFSQPDLFRWDYHEPFPQQMVADGEQLWHYDESLEQVTVREQPEAGESPLLVLTRPELLDRFYRIQGGDDANLLEFVPLVEDAEFEVARLYFVDGQPDMLELHDRFGQTTRIKLDQLTRNPDLDAKTFTFDPPPGVDVLEGY